MDNATVPIPPTPLQPAVPPSVKTQNHRWFLWLLGGLFVLALGIAVGLFSAKFLSGQFPNQPVINSYADCLVAKGSIVQESYPATCVTASGQRFTQPLTDEEKQHLMPPDGDIEPTGSAATANWRTYTNSKWGYSVKYPADQLVSCQYDQVEDGIKLWAAPFDCPDGHDIFYEVSVLGYSPDKLTRYKNPVISEQILFNGKGATKNIYKYGNEDGPLQAVGGSIEVLIPGSSGVIQLIVLSDNTAKVERFNQVLSTFKFTD